MVIRQGDVFWLNFGLPEGSGPGYRHPYVVVQNNVFNKGPINTVVVCGVTSVLKRGTAPGNVVLNKGEGNLRKQSVVNVSQVYTVDKSRLADKIGTLSAKRVREIVDGLHVVIEPRDLE